jgi:two-component system NtrC family sensor kinase
MVAQQEGHVHAEHGRRVVHGPRLRRFRNLASGVGAVASPSLLVVLLLLVRPGTRSHAIGLAVADAIATLALAAVAGWRLAGRLADLDVQIEAYAAHVARQARSAGLGTIASSIAHDLNNPLAVINEEAGWTLDLLDRGGTDEHATRQEIASSVSQIVQQVKRASQFTRRVLNWTREVNDRAAAVDVNSLLTRCAALLESDLSDAGIRLVWNLESPLPLVAGNEAEVGQVFLNLMKNAIDAMNNGGTLTIATARVDNMVTVRLADTGPGIAPELLGRIFEPFFTTKAGSGTGLGLAISRWTVQRAGGDISVDSTPGAGSTFHVTLAASERDASGRVPPATRAALAP